MNSIISQCYIGSERNIVTSFKRFHGKILGDLALRKLELEMNRDFSPKTVKKTSKTTFQQSAIVTCDLQNHYRV